MKIVDKRYFKNGFVDKSLVLLLSACIAWFIIFSAYYRHGIKPVLIVAFIAFIIISLRYKCKLIVFLKQHFTSTYAPFILFGLSAFVSTILSKDFGHSIGIFIERYVFYFIVFEIGRNLFVSQFVSRIFKESFGIDILEAIKYVFIIAGLVMGLGGIVDYIRFHPSRLWTVFGHEIQFLMLPLYICYFLPVVYCFVLKGNIFKERILAFLVGTLLFMCLIFTGSRTAWISWSICMLFVFFLIDKKYLRYFIPGILVCFCIIHYIMPTRLNDFGTGTWLVRADIMHAAFNVFCDNIFFGAGPGMYEKLVYKYSPGFIELHAHSTYLEILAELGIVGLLTFLAIFINFYWRVIKKFVMVRESANKFLYVGLLASNVSCLIFALFSSIITVGFHDAPMFWLIFGMSFGLGQRLKIIV